MRDLRNLNRAARRRKANGRRKSRRSTLAALTSSALALFGSEQASVADSPVSDFGIAYSYGRYMEDDLPSNTVISGSNERYTINTHQVTAEGPIGERFDVGFDFIYESMSGATPWWVQPDPGNPNGDPVQAMTGASIFEDRFDMNFRGNVFFDSGRLGANIGGSTENDYSAFYMGFDWQKTLEDQMTTINSGLSFSIDDIEPTGGGTGGRVVAADKDSVNAFAGLTYIINPRVMILGNLNYKYSNGFLSDPYKLAWITAGGGILVNDSRPDTRHQISGNAKLRYHVEQVNGTAQLDYRFHWGTWELTSHMIEAKWFQNLWLDRIALIPHFRYYTQSQAYFYRAFYETERPDGLASSDYRLAPYGAISFGARVQAKIEDWPGDLDWRVAVFYERYMSDADYAVGQVNVVNPGLVDYHFIYATFEFRFF